MARKSSAPAAPKPADPAPSDTYSGSSSEAESSEEPSPPPPPKSAAKAPIEEESSAGEEDDDDVSSDDSASDSAAADPVPPRPSAKPLASPQKPPAAADPVPPRPSAKPLASPQKPPAAAAAAGFDKKKRKAPEAPPPSPPQSNETGSGQKPQRFQRLWSNQDEIAILRGLINHQAKTGALPSKTDMAAFRDSIQKNLTMDANVTQLSEKIRRLKSKYAKNPSASPAKPHDSAVHELSHKIWGVSKALDGSGAVDTAEAANGSTARKHQKVKEVEGNAVVAAEAADGSTARKHQKVKEVEGNAAYSANVKPRYTYLRHAITRMGDCLPCSVTMEEVLDFADNSKAMEIEEKLKKLWNLQLKNQIREMEIKKEAKKIVMEALHKMA